MNKDEIALLEEKIKAADNTGTFSSMKLKSVSVGIVVHRHKTNIDEDYGLVAYYNTNPFKHYPINFMIWLRGLIRKYGNKGM